MAKLYFQSDDFVWSDIFSKWLSEIHFDVWVSLDLMKYHAADNK